MKILRRWCALFLLAALAPSAAPQSSEAAFTAADVHPSPRRSYPFFFAVLLDQNRYVMRDATMVDLISTAWGVDGDSVQGGPSWLEMDRFDLIAQVPPGTSKDSVRLMLRRLLSERFHVVTHPGSTPMPAYILSKGPGKPKLTASDTAGEPGCDDKSPPRTDAASYNVVSCHNITMDEFATRLRTMAGGYLPRPVVNSTRLEGQWNLDLKWSSRGDLDKAGADGISIFDAVEKQLGLKLVLETSPQPVLLVDSADETPTPNRPDIASLLPPAPTPQFEVATIKPSKAGTHGSGRIRGGEVNFTAISLKSLIELAWDLNESDPEVLAGAPKWLDEERFDILAKVSNQSTGRAASAGADLPMDIYEIQQMLQALLIERFAIKAHLETRPIDAYTLLATNPKLRPSDPTSRTRCKEGPGPDGKDPRLTSPILNRLVTCQHMTTQQIGDELQHVAGGYIYSPVADGTGLKGAYDFTLSFSSADRVLPGAGSASSSEPNGAVSVFDAVTRQLGLKLEKQKRPLPVLVIEHIEQRPTEN